MSWYRVNDTPVSQPDGFADSFADGITPEHERTAGYYPSKVSGGLPANPACVYDTPVIKKGFRTDNNYNYGPYGTDVIKNTQMNAKMNASKSNEHCGERYPNGAKFGHDAERPAYPGNTADNTSGNTTSNTSGRSSLPCTESGGGWNRDGYRDGYLDDRITIPLKQAQYPQSLSSARIISDLLSLIAKQEQEYQNLSDKYRMLSNPQQKVDSAYYYLLKHYTGCSGREKPCESVVQALKILGVASRGIAAATDRTAYDKWFPRNT